MENEVIERLYAKNAEFCQGIVQQYKEGKAINADFLGQINEDSVVIRFYQDEYLNMKELYDDTVAFIESKGLSGEFKQHTDSLDIGKHGKTFMMAVDYDEGEPATYKGITLLDSDSVEIFRVNTGNFRDDLKTMHRELSELTYGYGATVSSTFDNYAMDAHVQYADILEETAE
jgi:hypothetical protein